MCFEKLKDVVDNRLSTSFETDISNQDTLRTKRLAIEAQSEQRTSLRKELYEARGGSAKEMDSLDSRVQKMELEIEYLNGLLTDGHKQRQKEIDDRLAEQQAEYDSEIDDLEKLLAGKEAAFRAQRKANDDRETTERKTKLRAVNAVSDKITKYDEKMYVLRDSKADVSRRLARDAADLADLDAYFTAVDAAQAERNQLDRVKAKEEAAYWAARRHLDIAATVIQKMYRGFSVRKALKKKGKKGKGAKKGGGGALPKKKGTKARASSAKDSKVTKLPSVLPADYRAEVLKPSNKPSNVVQLPTKPNSHSTDFSAAKLPTRT